MQGSRTKHNLNTNNLFTRFSKITFSYKKFWIRKAKTKKLKENT